jgi:septal ring-binding cell division protein DamX
MSNPERDPKALLSAGGLLVAVAAILVLGAVLHGQVPAPAREPADVPASSRVAPAAAPLSPPVDIPADVPGDVPAEAADPGDSLDARARRDRARLAEGPGAWTLQLVVACKEEGVRRFLDGAGGDERLFLLPKDVSGRACFAVTWGTFSSEAEAAAAAPPASLPLTEPPRPRPLAAFVP